LAKLPSTLPGTRWRLASPIYDPFRLAHDAAAERSTIGMMGGLSSLQESTRMSLPNGGRHRPAAGPDLVASASTRNVHFRRGAVS
jgi:hypothetical protein